MTQSPPPLQFHLPTVDKTLQFGTLIGQQAKGGEVIAVTGELGAGKTTLARGIALGLGTPPELVSSPTFTLIQEYPGRMVMIHVDLYRLDSEAELSNLGIYEYFGENQVIFVEWADRFPQILPMDHIHISMIHQDEPGRALSLRGSGPISMHMVETLSHITQQGW